MMPFFVVFSDEDVPFGFQRTKMFGDYPREILSEATHKVLKSLARFEKNIFCMIFFFIVSPCGL